MQLQCSFLGGINSVQVFCGRVLISLSLLYLAVTCSASGRDPEEYRKSEFFWEITSRICFLIQRNACAGTPNARGPDVASHDSDLESESHDRAGLAWTGALFISRARWTSTSPVHACSHFPVCWSQLSPCPSRVAPSDSRVLPHNASQPILVETCKELGVE